MKKTDGAGLAERLFHLKQNGTTVRTEILAGLTAFMTVAYIIMLNPSLLCGGDDSLWNGVFMATCVASALAMFCMAFLANKPFILAPGMGLNSFFAVVAASIAGSAGVSYLQGFRAGLCIILIEGVVFCVLSVLNVRQKIVEAIPLPVRIAIAPAIGMMLLNIGFGSNAGVYGEDGSVYYAMRDFFGAMTAGTFLYKAGEGVFIESVLTIVTVFAGLFLIIVFARRGNKAAVLLGMLAASVIWWAGKAIFLGKDPFAALKTASFLPPVKDFAETTLFKFDFKGLFSLGGFTVVTLIVSFCMIDMFDTIGTFMGTASRAGMLDKNGNMPQMKQALLSDAIGTVAGACAGTSTVTTFVESVSGVEAGGRTGLTAFVTGVIFLLCTFLSPIAAIIPSAATSAALIYVGILMLMGLKNVHFDSMEDFAPAAIMLIAMPVSGSIGHAIGLGLISFSVIRLFTGRAKEVSVLTYVLSLLFLIKFFVAV